MLRIITLNLNGIRSAVSKGVLEWLTLQKADVVCMQEVKAQLPDLAPATLNHHPYSGHFSCAEKKGYSGVGMYCRNPPDKVIKGFGSKEFDAEGRYLRADYGKLSVISVYLPSGSSSEERQQAKFRFMREFMPHLATLKASGREIVLCGDWNIAHKEIDLKNWRGNRKNSGFLPEERAWLSQVFDELGWVDVYRRLHPTPPARLTPGGQTAARPGPRTSAGASTITSPPRGSRPRRRRPRSTKHGASAIMRL